METIEQVNEDFNVKKPKKKGLIITGIIAAVVIIAFILVYFLVLAKPQFIFNGAIDKLFSFNSKKYDSIRLESKIAASVESEDSSVQEQLAEVQKYALEFGVQMDAEQKKEIVDLGLEYDNEKVADAKVYYNDGDMYAYLEGLFDKYIKIDMEDEQKEEIEAIFDTVSSEENTKNTEKAMKIARDELKAQIKEYGEFEKEKVTIEIGDKEKKVTKSTLTLSQKQLYNVTSNMCSNLAGNDEFIDCFEESPKDSLKEIATKIKDAEADSKNNVKISIYTNGILNKLVAIDVALYSAEEAQTITASVVKEEENVYTYNVSVKSVGMKVDAIKGKIEIKKDKDSKNEQTGKAIITAEIIELGNAKLEIDYSIEYNKGVDKIDTSNSINITELTEEDIQGIMKKLMERPLIGNFITNQMNSLGTEYEEGIPDNNTQTLTTSQNEVKDEDYGYSVTYSVPTGFTYESDFSYDDTKYYELEEDDSYIDAKVSIDWYTEKEYLEDKVNWDYEYYTGANYKNVNLSEEKVLNIGGKAFKYVVLSYEDSDFETKYQNAYIWYALGDEYIFAVELEATDKEITENIIKGFLNINVKELS